MARGSRRPGQKKGEVKQPEGKVRRSQVLFTYGPGAMIDLVDDAVMVGGIDFWRGPHKTIHNPPLRDRIAYRFKQSGRGDLHPTDAFREPPVGEDDAPEWNVGVPALEFPKWFVCQNPDCRALVHCTDLDVDAKSKTKAYKHDCTRSGWSVVPVRFVASCPGGHIEDFPWVYFVHEGRRCSRPRLALDQGATGDFSQVKVRCDGCRRSRPLSEALAPKAMPDCRGRRPWLGKESDVDCTHKLRMQVRSASNAYFSQVESALHIPGADENKVFEAVKKLSPEAKEKLTPENFEMYLQFNETVRALLEGFDKADIFAVLPLAKANETPRRSPPRTAEYQAFIDQPVESLADTPGQNEIFFARQLDDDTPLPGIERIVLGHQLTETRVQVGFTRISPPTANLQGEMELAVDSADVRLTANWLPAIELRGEGIFIRLDEHAVRKWEERPAVEARAADLEAGYEAARASGRKLPVFPGVRFYLLHSLAHLLMNALALECGYAASAIRERIYCASRDDKVPMAAILLMTGTPGTEGTLGGLVDQGRRLGAHLAYARRLGQLCAHDPVCAAHNPVEDPSEQWLEGASCHGCLFVAESACEWFNHMLDRSLVVPTIGNPPERAFFGPLT